MIEMMMLSLGKHSVIKGHSESNVGPNEKYVMSPNITNREVSIVMTMKISFGKNLLSLVSSIIGMMMPMLSKA